jgi:hypothetical protein
MTAVVKVSMMCTSVCMLYVCVCVVCVVCVCVCAVQSFGAWLSEEA